MKIGIIGIGYVGLVHGVVLSSFGKDIICMDISKSKINLLKKGISPIYEPNLNKMIRNNIKAGKLNFTTNMKEVVESCEVIFLAVGTPAKKDGSANLNYVIKVVKEIGKYINGYKAIVNKSTVPIGTGKKLKKIIIDIMKRRNVDFEFDIISNPEFLREGRAVRDCKTPDRVVIGTESVKAQKIMKKVYNAYVSKKIPFIFTNIETAEMIKYASNAFLAIKISFINEMALLSEKIGADIQEVAKAMGMDKRISPEFLNAGPGYGGSCLPKDTKAILKIGNENNLDLKLIKSAIEVNENQKNKMVEKIIEKMNGVEGKTIAILGLTFKPKTNDLRDAPALEIIRQLIKNGAMIQAYCPKGIKEAQYQLKDVDKFITYKINEYEAVNGADALVIMTEWEQFKKMNLEKIYNNIKDYYFFDLRNIYSKKRYLVKKFKYFGVGIIEKN